VPVVITARTLAGWPLPEPDGARGKDGRGGVWVVGGCLEVPGAIQLAGMAALRVGVGRLQIATVRAVAPGVALAIPEARVVGLRQRGDGEIDASACRAVVPEMRSGDAILIGPGMGPSGAAAARALVRRCRAQADASTTLVLDAGGLRALSDERFEERSGSVIVTPHAGEMARLWGVSAADVRRRPLDVAREVAGRLGVVVVMKGEITYVVGPTGQALVNDAGCPGLGTAGSGDVLAGAIAGLCARGASALQAAAWAVHLHAKAGERLARRVGPLGFLARELLDELPGLMARSGRA
jgi:ADP-dependent NAD(P)H-hydrate dehydratase